MIANEYNTLEPAKWVNNHAEYLYNYAASRLYDKETARDLIQDVFLAALQKIDSFEGRSTERTWLTSILRNKIIDIYRKKSVSTIEIDSTQSTISGFQDFFEANGHWMDKHRPLSIWADEFDSVRSKEFEKILEQCMKKLPGVWMTVFSMKYLDDDSTKSICKELGITPSNYWIIIHRAKLNLRACLQKNWI